MAARQEPETNPSRPVLVDPHGVHIQYVDSLITLGSSGGVANLVIGTRHIEPRPDKGPDKFVVIAARLRFTRHFAQQLRDSLDKMLTADEKKNGEDD
jgi:hypothetical protein